MMISTYALNSMGFRKMGEAEELSATFRCLYVYEINGLTFDDSVLLPFQGTISGSPYSVAVGNSVTALSRAIANDDFVQDEHAWTEEKGCRPPYVVVQLVSGRPHSCVGGFVKEEGTALLVHDGFSSARTELRQIQDRMLPPLVSALTCRLRKSSDHPVSLRAVDKYLFGLTADSRLVHDQRIEVKAVVSVARRIGIEDVRVAMEDAVSLAGRLEPKASKFFFWALEEESICAWPGISDMHVEEFARLKKVRDDIAHGSIHGPPDEAVGAVERLAVALQLQAP